MTKRIILGEGPEFLKREGLAAEPELREDGLRADTGPGTFEWWYFDAHFEDGSTAVIVYCTKPLLQRRDPLTPFLQFTITRPDGKKLSAFPIYPTKDFAALRERCDVQIGPNWVRGDLHRYELHAEAQDLAADLVFTGIVPPWRPGTGIQYFDEAMTRYFGWLPSISYGPVEGTLTYDGQSRQVKGTGYHDHNWGNIDLNEVYSHWYWGRAHIGEYSSVFAEITATKEYGEQKLPYFMLARGDRILTTDGHPLALRIDEEQRHPSGKTYASRLDLDWRGSDGTIHLALRELQIIEAISLLLLLPTWKRLIARLFANPYYFRFNSQIDLAVDLNAVQARERGSALYELMILH